MEKIEIMKPYNITFFVIVIKIYVFAFELDPAIYIQYNTQTRT